MSGYISDNPLFRDLTPEEVDTLRKWARDNYKPGDSINPLWHPVVRDECENINEAFDWSLHN